jgi:hypothetical protein
MEGTQITFWNSGVWLIPLILLATIAGLIWLGVRLRAAALARLKAARSQIRAFRHHRRQIAAQTAGNSIADGEPYLSCMAELENRLNQVDARMYSLEKQFVELQESVLRLKRRTGIALISAPFWWYRARQQAEQLSQKTLALQPDFQAAEEIVQRIEQVAWEVAEEARRVRGLLEESGQVLQKLSAQSLRGAGLEAAVHLENACREALAHIPALFFEADPETLLQQANKETVAAVFHLLSQERPRLESLCDQAHTWEAQHQEVIQAVSRLRQQLARLETALANPPAGLDLQAEIKAAGSLHATLSRLEVDSLPVALAESRRVLQAAQELESQVIQARHQRAALERALTEIKRGLDSTSTQFALLAASTVRPLAWGQSRTALASLRRQANNFHSPGQARSPEQTQRDWETAQRLQKELLELSAACQAASLQHGELARLLLLPELADWRDWLAEAHSLAERVSTYAAENWPRQDNLAALAADLKALGAGLERLAGDDRSRPIEEGELAQALAETQRYVEAYLGQRRRTAVIGRRLAELQALEKTTSERIAHTLLLLQQATHLVQSNPFLSQAADNEPARLKSELNDALAELRQPERGLVEKKARQAEARIGKVIQAIQDWMGNLTADLQAQIRQLSSLLASLEVVTALDEPTIHQARETLDAGPAHTGRYAPSSPSLEGLLGELKRRCDYWNRLAASRQALEDTARPVLDNYQAANGFRQFARGEIQEIADLLRESRGWPPASISIQAERQELARLEEQWEGLKTQRLRSAQLAAQLSGLGARYQALGERARQAAERFTQDQAQASDLENDYNELVQLWQAQARAYENNPQTKREINDLLSRADREMVSIRQAYRQGTRSYNQVLQGLRTLVRDLRGFPAMIDENHTVDVYGHVKRAR